jgi:hypothetical protein
MGYPCGRDIELMKEKLSILKTHCRAYSELLSDRAAERHETC